MKKIIALIIALIIVGAGTAVLVLSFQRPQVEKVTIESIEDFTNSSFTLKYSVRVYNPNIIGVNITSIRYNLLLNGENLSNGTSAGAYLPPLGSADFSFVSTIQYRSAFDIPLMILLKQQVPMEVNGVATAHGLLISGDVPFNYSFDAYPLLVNASSGRV
jgi:hypothetical protein